MSVKNKKGRNIIEEASHLLVSLQPKKGSFHEI